MTDTFYDIVMATLGERLSEMTYNELATYLAELRDKAEKYDKLEGYLHEIGMNALLQAVDELSEESSELGENSEG